MDKLNILDTAMRCGTFQTFTRLLEGSRLEQELRSNKCFTVFAPADIAFAFIPSEILTALVRAESSGRLTDVLSYHAVSGKLMRDDFKNASELRTICGQCLLISDAGEMRIGGARLIQEQIEASNGVIHPIDRLLVPNLEVQSALV